MNDVNLLSRTPRRDPIHGLLVGHAESGAWRWASRHATDVVIVLAVIALALIRAAV